MIYEDIPSPINPHRYKRTYTHIVSDFPFVLQILRKILIPISLFITFKVLEITHVSILWGQEGLPTHSLLLLTFLLPPPALVLTNNHLLSIYLEFNYQMK